MDTHYVYRFGKLREEAVRGPKCLDCGGSIYRHLGWQHAGKPAQAHSVKPDDNARAIDRQTTYAIARAKRQRGLYYTPSGELDYC